MANRLVKNLRDDYLSCTICLEQYKTPKSLPCEHAFCEACLINHAEQTARNSSLQCPVCRETVNIGVAFLGDIGQWVNSLPTDTLLNSLLDTLNIHDNEEHVHKGYKPLVDEGCRQHGGKARDAYCFTHVKTICWECAARNHRNCSIDSLKEAGHVIEPKLKSIKSRLDEQLRKSRDMCKDDHTFTESKAKTLCDLKTLEKRLDTIYLSTKKQFSLLKEEIELHNRNHLEQRKEFYDMVTFLFEMNSTLETIDDSEDVANAFLLLEKLEEGIGLVTDKMAAVESTMDEGMMGKLRFVVDDDMRRFVQSYTSVGFIDTNISEDRGNPMSPEPPSSIAHLLTREPTILYDHEGADNE